MGSYLQEVFWEKFEDIGLGIDEGDAQFLGREVLLGCL